MNIEAGPDIPWDSEVLVLLLQSLTRSLRTLRLSLVNLIDMFWIPSQGFNLDIITDIRG